MKLYLFIFVALFQIKIFAQQSYIQYTVKDGLPQMQCMQLFQDSKGYIWVGTKGGISRYDGIHFKNYTINDGLPNNGIIKINEDKNGNIWVLTSSGLSIFKDNRFVFYKPKENLFFKSPKLIIDNEQNIWLIENYYQKTIIKFTNKEYKKVFPENNNPIVNMSYDKINNRIFFTNMTKKGMQLYSIKDNRIIKQQNKKSFFHFNHSEKIAYKKSNSKQGKYTLFKLNNTDTTALFKSTRIFRNTKRINDSTLIFTEGQFLLNMPLHYLVNGKLRKNPKRFDQINDILIDNEKNTWIASEKGLFKLTAFNNYTANDGMPNYVWSVQEDINNKIWFASYNNNHALYNLQNGVISKHSKKFKNTAFYMGAIKTKSGDLLFPHGSGIIKYDGKSFSDLDFPVPAASVSVFEDSKTENIYFGTYEGLVIRDSIGNYTINKSFVNGKNEIIQKIVKNKKGELWYVTNKTFGMLNQKDTLVLQKDIIKGAVTLYCDYKDNLWIGTHNGLFFYDYKTFVKIIHPELKTMIGAIQKIDKTHFVYGGLRGIGILNLEKFYTQMALLTSEKATYIDARNLVDYYTQSQGFLGEEIGQNGMFKDSNGQIWIPTNNNVVMFHPKDLKKNETAPYTYITNFQTSTDLVNWNSVNDTITALKNKQINIRFDFIGISHTAPNLVKYKYRLKGFNDNWSNETKERYISFTNLKPKDYTFELLARNSNGIWNKKAITRSFTIVPSWQQTLSFKIIASAFILFLIFQIISFQYKNKLKKEKLANRLNELQLQAKQSQIYPHLLFNAVSATGSVIYKENKEKAYDFVVKLSKFMRLALNDTKKTYKTLKEEMDFVQAYLEIQKIRFPERFNCEINIAKNVNLSIRIPQMIVQTYVENAVKYGLEPLAAGGLLTITISQENNILIIVIEDNGIGINAAKNLSEKGTGSGLKIMNEIYEIHNKNNKNKISFELVDLYQQNKKGTQSVIRIVV